MLNKRILIWGTLFSIVAFTIWLDHGADSVLETTPNQAEVNQKIDYYLENFKITQLNAQGQKNYTLSGTKLMHYRDTDTADVVSPQLLFIDEQAMRWTIQSDRAWVSKNSDYIHLLGIVNITRQAQTNTPPLDILTSNLKIRTQDHFAETADQVTIQSPGWQTNAQGFTANLTTGQFSLLSQVKGRYSHAPQ